MLTERDVIDGLSAGVLIASSDEVATYANPAARRMLQLGAEASIAQPVPLLLGMSASLRDHGLDAPDSERRLVLELPTGRSGATVQNVDGRGFVCLFRPYDEGRGADGQLLRIERESAISAILASFAHEVRNPLAALTAAMEMLLAEIPPGTGEGHLAIIARQVRRLAALSSAPLALGRPSAVQRVLCTIDQLVGDAVAAVATEARRRGVEVAVALTPGLPRVAVGERELVDALAEVLENAVHASLVGGVVSVTARRLAPAPGVPLRVAIEIADQGAGLAPMDIVESLRPFTTSKTNAAGVGLALAHRNILDSGGRLAIATPSQGGLVVCVELTAEEQQ